MAGMCKPYNYLIEASYTVNSFVSSTNGSSENGDSCGLFDGSRSGGWNLPQSFYWSSNGHYLDITINDDCKIWRSGDNSYYVDYESKLKIEEFVNNEWIDITSSIYQKETAIKASEWDTYISYLPAGRYKFSFNAGYRLDSEWFIEKLPLYILKQDGKYYSIKDENYDSEIGMYDEISLSDFNTMKCSINKLYEEITIGGETFKPIDKFTRFTIIGDNNSQVNVKCIKQQTQMVVASDSFGVRSAANIDYFKGYYTLSADSSIKVVVSIDGGVIWKTFNGTSWSDLDITIPQNMYGDLTVSEKHQWDNAKDIIFNQGIDISELESIDFNDIRDSNMMFAYVLYMPALDSVCKNQSLEWKFDSRGRMKKMKDTEYDLYLTYDNIVVTPLAQQSMIKINVVG